MKMGSSFLVASAATAAGSAIASALSLGAPIPAILSSVAALCSLAALAVCGAKPRAEIGQDARARLDATVSLPVTQPAVAQSLATEPAQPSVEAKADSIAAETGARLSMAHLRLRYADSILAKVPVETESAAFSLMERITAIRDQSEKARRSAMASNSGAGASVTIQELATHARNTIAGVRAAVSEMRQYDRTAAAELQTLSKEISAGMSQLAEIGEITEWSRLIAFNMAIEAARIGSKGNGFKVIVNELRDLNDQTAVFSKRVSELLGRFRDFTDSLVRKTNAESSAVAEEVERGIQDEEKAIESLMAMSHACLDMSSDIEQVVGAVNKDLDGILESLQFQDITRQIVEGAQAILKDAREELDDALRSAGNGDGGRLDQSTIKELKVRLIASSHTAAEKEAIQEVVV